MDTDPLADILGMLDADRWGALLESAEWREYRAWADDQIRQAQERLETLHPSDAVGIARAQERCKVIREAMRWPENKRNETMKGTV